MLDLLTTVLLTISLAPLAVNLLMLAAAANSSTRFSRVTTRGLCISAPWALLTAAALPTVSAAQFTVIAAVAVSSLVAAAVLTAQIRADSDS